METTQRSGAGRNVASLALFLILLIAGPAALAALAGDQPRDIAARTESPLSSLMLAGNGSDSAARLSGRDDGRSGKSATAPGDGKGEDGSLELEREALDNSRLEREQELRRAREREAERARGNEEMLRHQRDAQKRSIERTLKQPDVRSSGEKSRDN